MSKWDFQPYKHQQLVWFNLAGVWRVGWIVFIKTPEDTEAKGDYWIAEYDNPHSRYWCNLSQVQPYRANTYRTHNAKPN